MFIGLLRLWATLSGGDECFMDRYYLHYRGLIRLGAEKSHIYTCLKQLLGASRWLLITGVEHLLCMGLLPVGTCGLLKHACYMVIHLTQVGTPIRIEVSRM
jgi:hypothetical protein